MAVDSLLAATELSSAAKAAGTTLGLLVDIDVGMGRTGVATPQLALELAQHISQLPSVKLEGIMCYPGHVWCKAEEQAGPLGKGLCDLARNI